MQNGKKWYESEKNRSSAMRIMSMISTITGCVVALLGAIIVWAGIPEGVQVSLAGAGMSGIGEISKMNQRKSENKND